MMSEKTWNTGWGVNQNHKTKPSKLLVYVV